MSERWRFFLLGYLWSLPNTLAGLLIAIAYRPTSIRWRRGRIECLSSRIWWRPGAQTLGIVVYYSTERARDDAGLVHHEWTHVVQALIGGPLFALAYGLCHCYLWLRLGDFRAAYDRNPFEVQAYRHQAELLASRKAQRSS